MEATTKVHADFEPVRATIVTDPGRIVGERHPDAGLSGGVLRASLTLTAHAMPGAHEDVLVEVLVRVGVVRSGPAEVVVPLAWQAAGWPRLFPTFGGVLEASPDSPGSVVRLRGTYTVRPSALGRFGDGVAGRRLARQAGTAFLAQVALRLDGREPHRPDLALWRPGAYPVAVEELLQAGGDRPARHVRFRP